MKTSYLQSTGQGSSSSGTLSWKDSWEVRSLLHVLRMAEENNDMPSANKDALLQSEQNIMQLPALLED